MRKFLMLGFIALCAVVGVTATAQASNPGGAEPGAAAYISSGTPQTIAANSSQWYKFEYVGDKSLITILMPNGTDSLVAFNVFTPEGAQSWWEPKNKPVGRGTPYSIDCTTGEEVYYGECKSADLKWKGQFNFPGTFYVQVVNYNTGTANFKLTIEGTGVIVPPPAVLAAAESAPVKPAPVKAAPAPATLPTSGGVWIGYVAPHPLPWKIEVDWYR